MTAYRLISEPQADLDIEAVLNLGVSADLGLSRFHGADPLQIAAGPYDLQLRFDPPPLASPPPRGYSAREFSRFSRTTWCKNPAGRRRGRL